MSKHGTWRSFLVMPDSLAGLDREGGKVGCVGTDDWVNGQDNCRKEGFPP